MPTNTHDINVFHAGTAQSQNGLITNCGRVLCVTALGKNMQEAREKVYATAQIIQWPDRYYRADIGMM